jgi:hypothetical protein
MKDSCCLCAGPDKPEGRIYSPLSFQERGEPVASGGRGTPTMLLTEVSKRVPKA